MELICCYMGEIGHPPDVCYLPAEWQIDGPGFEDQTFACTEHVGDLLADAPCYTIVPVE